MTFTELYSKKNLFQPHEKWLKDNLLMETIVGSHMYGCNDDSSDFDFIAVSMDQHQYLFPQQYGYILNFDNVPKFNSKELKGDGNKIVLDNGRDVEGGWHSLTNFFYLAGIKCSPALVEILFAREHLYKFIHPIGAMIKDNRKLFLSLQSFNAFKGYAFSQLQRIKREKVRWDNEQKCDNSKRRELYEKYGYDTKMSYHILRLVDQLKQIVTECNIDLMRNREELKAMRKGTWGTFQELEEYTLKKLDEIESLTFTSALSKTPQIDPLRKLLNNCIEQWYGSIDKSMKQQEFVSANDVMEKLISIETMLKNNK